MLCGNSLITLVVMMFVFLTHMLLLIKFEQQPLYISKDRKQCTFVSAYICFQLCLESKFMSACTSSMCKVKYGYNS